MSTTSMIIIGIVLVLAIGGAIALYQYQKKNLEKLFTQVYETSKQVPKQKKTSFQLLMFKEAMSASLKKSKKAPSANQLNNPKYIEIQMMHMSRILKDTSSVKDKKIKRALRMLKDYQTWEASKNAKNKQASQSKAAPKPTKGNQKSSVQK
ncbi:hypothetical protein [Fusibacter ferrireducens]|uniref:Uncharacterized protein n=1 Tax=Fusibacter ferrireducens TaxID=2785058 RepID=A0ABR9ZSG6_9FIRM|nr:hypothetical protein [Fusibacter ferrireducens]MBF4692896.1 hypothetical protein [Fusibacter ferrireducens]